MPLLFERVFVVIALLLYSGAIGPFIGDTNRLAPVKEACAIAGVGIVLLLLLPQWKRALFIASRDKLLWILVGFTLISFAWSDYPSVTISNVMPILRITLFGLYFATRYTISQQMRWLAWAFALGAFLSLVIAIAFPFYGVMGHGLVITMELVKHSGVWRGAYIHKTALGSIMAMGVLTFIFHAVQARGYQRAVMWAGVAFCAALLMMSTTKAALLIVFIALCLIPFYRALRWNGSLAIPFFIIVLLIVGSAAVIFVANADQILGAFGRDITFSGRTRYWPLMIAKALQRPWFGYGFGTFWHGGWKGEPADIWRFLADGDEPPHAHNGFISVWLSIGAIGLFIFALGYLVNWLRSIQWARRVHTAEGLVPLTVLTLVLLFNLTEAALMEPDIIWLFYVSTTLSMHNRFTKLSTSEGISKVETTDQECSKVIIY